MARDVEERRLRLRVGGAEAWDSLMTGIRPTAHREDEDWPPPRVRPRGAQPPSFCLVHRCLPLPLPPRLVMCGSGA